MKKVLTAIVTFVFSLCLICATLATASAASVKKVTGFKASAKPTEITLTWKKTSGAKGYEVQQKSGKKWKTVATIKKQKTTSYTVKKLKNGKTYQFRIRAVNGKKKGSYVTVKAKTGVQKITSVKATSTGLTSAKLTWEKANVTGYEIQKKDGKKWKTVKKIKKAKTTSLSVSKLSAGAKTTFRIRGYVSGSAKTFYGSYTTVSVTTAVAPMKSVSVKSVTDSTATIGWAKVSGATGYEVQQYVSGKWVAAHSKTLSSKTTSLTVKKLAALTTHKFRVRAVQKSGKKNYYNSWVTVNAKTKIGKAGTVKYSSLKPTSVKLTWSAAGGAAGYRVLNNGSKIADVKTNSATLTIKAGTAYKISVVPYNGSTTGTATSAISFTSPCAKVTGVKASAVAENSLTFSWSKPTGAASYQVQYAKNGGSWSSPVSVTGTSYQIKDLAANTKYNFRVRAVNKNGSTTQYGDYSATASATTKGVASNAKDTLSWSSVSGASTYTVQTFNTETLAWETVASKLTATSYKNTAISADATKLYRVVAYDKNGKAVYTSKGATANISGVSFSVSDNALSVTWDKYEGATAYALKIKSVGMADDGATVVKAAASARSVKSHILAPGLTYNLTLTATKSGKETEVASFAVKTSALTTGTSDKEVNAQLLYLVEAINRTKYDEMSKSVTVRNTPYNRTEVKYVDFGIQGATSGLKEGAVNTLLNLLFESPEKKYSGCKVENGFITCSSPEAIDGLFATKDAEGNVTDSMALQETGGKLKIYYFLNGVNTNGYKLNEVIQPLETASNLAYLYNSNNASAWKNGVKDVKATLLEDGSYEIKATLKTETTPNYHDGFIAGASVTNMGDMGLGDAGKAKLDSKVGETTIEAVIDGNCLLTSYKIYSPYKYDMKVEVALASDELTMADEDDTSSALSAVMKLFEDIVIEMNTKVEGYQQCDYTITRVFPQS